MTCYNIDGDEEFKDEDNIDIVVIRAGYHSCGSSISFTDEDLLLGSTPHNRPLFVVGFTYE